jgi:hypothetical protein
MKIIYNKLIPFKGFTAINLFGFLFVRSEFKGKFKKRSINHEMIHTAQMKELLYVPFYIWYLAEWCTRVLVSIFKPCTRPYHDICFEREAYDNESNLKYLDSRKRFAFFRKK